MKANTFVVSFCKYAKFVCCAQSVCLICLLCPVRALWGPATSQRQYRLQPAVLLIIPYGPHAHQYIWHRYVFDKPTIHRPYIHS
jgi:hypothetical protein